METFIPLLTEKPAKYLGIPSRKGFLEKGMDADFTIWSPEKTFKASTENNYHKHKISPYIGTTLFGKIEATYVNGIEVFNQKILNKKAGKWILN